ncbi:hypothetical protein J2Y41_004035 [Arthrobacter sp. 1088]|uniref:antitoxin Xre/MbcA/ParS toxin-binding domain-containing protein n=1 Tax=Arthrobacter sp. 1088 TaxID=2817768 RepID=UPI0028566D49|nr:antitoxin Xre/MbcA/ParS toxin-binding domain-containing protein [Arthrobacter sp. 1088]MDR6688445.1 hypothetical protein [Arthrobacter sp. 1088]
MSIALLADGQFAVEAVQDALDRTPVPASMRRPLLFAPTIETPGVDAAVLVIQAMSGPTSITSTHAQRIKKKNIPILSAILVGTKDAENQEMVDQFEAQCKKILTSSGLALDSVVFTNTPGYELDEAFYEEEFVNLVGTLPDEVRYAEGWKIYGEALGSRSRTDAVTRMMTAGQRDGDARNFPDEVATVVSRAVEYWPRSAAVIWLRSPNQHLDGATPVEFLPKHGPEQVLAALDASLWGTFA